MRTRKPSTTIAEALPEPDDKQREAIAYATDRVQERTARATTHVELKGQALNVAPPHTDTWGWGNHIKDAFGTSSADFTALEMDRLVSALGCNTKAGAVQAQTAANAALAAIAAAQPKDEIEAMLASQMAVTHALVMDLMGRTKRAQYQPQFEMAGNMAVKLLRTFTAQTEALAKLRRGGVERRRGKGRCAGRQQRTRADAGCTAVQRVAAVQPEPATGTTGMASTRARPLRRDGCCGLGSGARPGACRSAGNEIECSGMGQRMGGERHPNKINSIINSLTDNIADVVKPVDTQDLKADSAVHELTNNSLFSRSFEWR